MSIFKDLIGGGIKGIADSAVSIIKQFKLSPPMESNSLTCVFFGIKE